MRVWIASISIIALTTVCPATAQKVFAHCQGDKNAPCDGHNAASPGCEANKAGGACEGKAAGAASGAALQAQPGEAVYVLGIEGMTCPEACPPQVKQSIEGIKGVRNVEISFQDKRAIVRTDAGVELTTADIDKSFKNQGYSVSSLEKIPAKQ